MKSIKNLVFLGMMGSGKTTIGSIISKKLKMKFFDIDQVIENETKKTISEIFKKNGEKFFRELEEKITLEKLKEKNSVISLGGGGFTNNKIQAEVLSKHISIWLKWSAETLIKKIQNSKKRPLAYKLNDEQLKTMMKIRAKFYSKALHKINCDNLTKSEIVNTVINFYETDHFKS